MKVGLLNLAQKNEIEGKEFAPDSYFNPIQDALNRWVISIQEMEQAGKEIDFLKGLELIEFEPIVYIL